MSGSWLCWLLGHAWASYNVGTASPEQRPEFWLNDRCVRCDEHRNPLIANDQRRLLRSPGGAVETGDWCKAKGHGVARALWPKP